MKKSALFIGWVFTSLCPSMVYADNAENPNNCEIVLIEQVTKEVERADAQLASFRPADDFLSSVYDGETGFQTQIDGLSIRGVMCQRAKILPTLRDFPVLATGIPLSLSDDFDRPDSQLMTIFYRDGKFQYKYSGEDLDQTEHNKLVDIMDVFNLQPHDLPKLPSSDTQAP